MMLTSVANLTCDIETVETDGPWYFGVKLVKRQEIEES